MKKSVNVTLDNDVLDHIDSVRGLTSRSAIVDALIKKGLENNEIKVAHLYGGGRT